MRGLTEAAAHSDDRSSGTRDWHFHRRVVKGAVQRFVAEDAMTRSAALAFYMVFSLPPMLLIILWGSGRFYQEALVREAIFSEIGKLAGEAGARQMTAAIESLSVQEPRWWVAAGTVGMLLFTASTVLVNLKDAMSRIFRAGTVAPKSAGMLRALRDRFISMAMILTISFMLTVSLMVNALIAALGARLAQWFGEPPPWLALLDAGLLSLGVLTVLFAVLFRFFPDVHLNWRDIGFGAVLTAALFVAGQNLIGVVIGNSSAAQVYSAAGSVIVLMLWAYYASAVFLFGAIVTATRAELLEQEQP